MATKLCAKCKESKPLSEFYKRKDGTPRSWCKVCNRACATRWYAEHPGESAKRSKAWRQANPERYKKLKESRRERDRITEIKRRYKLSEAEYLRITKRHAGKCGICKRPFSRREPCVDHCHNSLKVRGLLCQRCNSVLGYMEDNPELFISAARYLRRSVKTCGTT